MSQRDADTFDRRVFGLLILGGLLLAGAYVLLPFLGAILWAIILAVSVWPLYMRLSAALGGRRSLAALGISLLFFLVLFIPITAALVSATEQIPQAVRYVRAVGAEGIPPPPVMTMARTSSSGFVPTPASVWRSQMAPPPST